MKNEDFTLLFRWKIKRRPTNGFENTTNERFSDTEITDVMTKHFTFQLRKRPTKDSEAGKIYAS